MRQRVTHDCASIIESDSIAKGISLFPQFFAWCIPTSKCLLNDFCTANAQYNHTLTGSTAGVYTLWLIKPSSGATGYTISYTGGGSSDSVTVSGGSTDERLLTGLQNGATYTDAPGTCVTVYETCPLMHI